MITTPQVVKRLFLQSDTAQLAAAEGLLNVSAFARKIQQSAEKAAMKDIAVGTITTALYRLLEEKPATFKPKVELTDLNIHSKISELTYDKTESNLKKLTALMFTLSSEAKGYYTITQGTEEITVIADAKLTEIIQAQLGEPKARYDNVTAISVNFDKKYLTVPNMIYTLMASLAVKRVNVMEIVSTLTSITFVVAEEEMEKTIAALKRHLI